MGPFRGARGLNRRNILVYRPLRPIVNLQGAVVAGVGCMLLQTAHETTLDGLIERPLGEGDLLTNANTVIYLGKIREGSRFRRALYVAKHRGSVCSDEIIPYTIDDAGLGIEE